MPPKSLKSLFVSVKMQSESNLCEPSKVLSSCSFHVETSACSSFCSQNTTTGLENTGENVIQSYAPFDYNK